MTRDTWTYRYSACLVSSFFHIGPWRVAILKVILSMATFLTVIAETLLISTAVPQICHVILDPIIGFTNPIEQFILEESSGTFKTNLSLIQIFASLLVSDRNINGYYPVNGYENKSLLVFCVKDALQGIPKSALHHSYCAHSIP